MEAEHRLAVAQREVARLRQHIRLDGDTIEDLQDQCGALFVRLNEVAVIAARVPTLEAESSVVRQRAGGLAEELARERQRAEQAESTLHGEVERGAHLGLESGKWLRQIDELKGVAQAQAEATRTAEARGDALQLRGDEVARENDQLRAKLDAAETEAARLRAEGDALGARLVAEERRRAEAEALCSQRLRAQQHGQTHWPGSLADANPSSWKERSVPPAARRALALAHGGALGSRATPGPAWPPVPLSPALLVAASHACLDTPTALQAQREAPDPNTDPNPTHPGTA